ncbi:hypothetical protein C8J57DRAFT_339999 [Mycena rebaudengoi]|nr:hypothetical protein C8J57DRAFT_339999 [Mycena rebaudengoi]
MVLTRRAYKDISRWLPNEVILEIIDGLTVGDWLSLCGVSKLFHGLCIPFVYRSVKLETWATILSFCSVIVGNPAHAPLVRSFVVSRPTDLWTQYFEEELDALLPEALIIMVNLNHFSICESVWENNTNFLRHYTFPLLVSCYIHSTFKLGCPDMISSFLNRHPTLKVVRISTSFLFRPSVLTPSITLPNITYYEGPSAWFHYCTLAHADSKRRG